MYPYPVSNSVPGQQGKYRGAKGAQGGEEELGLSIASWQTKLELRTVPLHPQAHSPLSALTNTNQPQPHR